MTFTSTFNTFSECLPPKVKSGIRHCHCPTFHDLLELQLQGLYFPLGRFQVQLAAVAGRRSPDTVQRQAAFCHRGHIIILQEYHLVCVLDDCTTGKITLDDCTTGRITLDDCTSGKITLDDRTTGKTTLDDRLSG